jgi:hypothetical protein
MIDDGWENFVFGQTLIIDYHPASIVHEADGVKVWVQFISAKPIPLGPHGKYDFVRSSYKFFCKSHQQLLIQGTYKLGGNTVWERLSNESILEEIEPGTVSGRLHGFFCKGPGAPPESNKPITELSDAEFDALFRCPESIGSDEEREHAMRDFLRWIHASHPDWNTIAKIVYTRMFFLEKHECTKTLEYIRKSSPAK